VSISTEHFCELIHQHHISPRLIMEIGTLDGADTKILRSEFPDSRIVAIDANPDFLPALREIKCEAHTAVITRRSAATSFFKKLKEPNLSGVYDRGSSYAGVQETREGICLQDFCTEHQIDEISILKIDAEGSTWDILTGMGSHLLQTVKMMHIETEDYPFFAGQKLHADVCYLLTTRGFSPLLVEGAAIPPGRQFDSVWMHKGVLDGR
jgi:FkbM family methyltransferase